MGTHLLVRSIVPAFRNSRIFIGQVIKNLKKICKRLLLLTLLVRSRGTSNCVIYLGVQLQLWCSFTFFSFWFLGLLILY